MNRPVLEAEDGRGRAPGGVRGAAVSPTLEVLQLPGPVLVVHALNEYRYQCQFTTTITFLLYEGEKTVDIFLARCRLVSCCC